MEQLCSHVAGPVSHHLQDDHKIQQMASFLPFNHAGPSCCTAPHFTPHTYLHHNTCMLFNNLLHLTNLMSLGFTLLLNFDFSVYVAQEQQMVHIRLWCSHYSHLNILPTMAKACIPALKKLVSRVHSQKITACFMLAFPTNHLPARCFSGDQKKEKSVPVRSGPQRGWPITPQPQHHNGSQVQFAVCQLTLSCQIMMPQCSNSGLLQ